MCGSDTAARGELGGARVPVRDPEPSDVSDDKSPQWNNDALAFNHKSAIYPSAVLSNHPGMPDTRLSDYFKGQTYTKNPSTPVFDDFSTLSIWDAYVKVEGVAGDVAPGSYQQWSDVATKISTATETFHQYLNQLDQSDDGWFGTSHDAALKNVTESFPATTTIATGATVLGALADAFTNTMKSTHDQIVTNFNAYLTAVKQYPQLADQINNEYNQFAQTVMTKVYSPHITDIASGHPSFAVTLPTPNSQQSLNGGAPPFPDGGVGGTPLPGGVGALPGGVGAPPLPGTSVGPTLPGGVGGPVLPGVANAQAALPFAATPTSASTSPGSALQDLSGLTSPLQSLDSPLQSALSQATNAARPGANPGAFGGAYSPPEGVVGLGPKGLNGPLAKGGAGGGPVPGAARGVLTGRPPGAPATAAGTGAPSTVAAGSRAGLSGAAGVGAGAPGAGAPGAGNHGAAAAGGNHQPSKVLRRKRNGEQLIGDSEAVVPVLGETAPPEAAKPEPTVAMPDLAASVYAGKLRV